ncbi:shikimate kinase [Pseudobacteroides cellulosolvens]|uniref:Shikimate kinase n=1 Tax=Pseudobacteroides cellulosolvens ATCC 35603 = DSM 2933 TaxID=398512 RepID=A0A0L6JT12_9FIRM|nr:shikimate kinase [Pseudobacteroides cellulosolvens]KNY28562.1 Shikimate kinase [Pseudobacteroides cellulosolvens ATCC 35603 = DSM 2933]
MNKSNIIMIGMPSSGKTTVGSLLSDKTGKSFLDTDHLLQSITGLSPRDYVISHGLEKFLEIQEKVIMDLSVENSIIATGGGVIYSKEAMEHLKKNGIVVYLKTDFEILENRVAQDRKLARKDGKSFYDTYLERIPLYENYGDILIECKEKPSSEISEEILNIIQSDNIL